MAIVDIALFGLIPGAIIWVVQMAWIPFWAAGVINGIGHWFGYRNWGTGDASRNISPWGILIGGEELHNNHHAYATSAKLSSKWYEFDIGWMYIRLLEMAGLARVKKVAPTPRFTDARAVVDLDTLQAVITHRYDVLAKYAKSLKKIYAEEVGKLRRHAPHDAEGLKPVKRWLHREESSLAENERLKLEQALARHSTLKTVYNMRKELTALWDRSTASSEQLLKHLQDWCHRADASGIRALQEFSLRLRSYS
jgi:stearoyl-CoA desaturase (delta-9 desaturase)